MGQRAGTESGGIALEILDQKLSQPIYPLHEFTR